MNKECHICGEDAIVQLDGNWLCQDHADRWAEGERYPSQEEIDDMYALYRAEKHAGLTKTKEEYEHDLRIAGRGHLIRRE